MKRRSSASGVNERCTSPIIKRTKVHAQRKFAQGCNNFVTTPTKLPKPSESTTQALSPESNCVAENNDRELNNFSNLPTIDDFLTFLCYRETEVLPERLNYLNTPQFESIPVKKKPSKPNFTVPQALPSSKSSTDQNKASDKVNSSFKSKKKVPEYKLRSNDIKCKPILSKTSRSLALKHNQRLRKTVQTKFNDSKLPNFKNKSTTNKFPLVPKNGVSVKVNNLKNHPITRALSNTKPTPKIVQPESVVRRVTRRNSNLNALAEKIDLPAPKSTPNRTSKSKKPSITTKQLPIAVENTRIPTKRLSAKPFRIEIPKFEPLTPSKPVTRSTRSSTAKLESNHKTPITSTRPTRKTKEAATLYMETLGRDLLRDDESFDDEDNLSIDSFLELPSFESAKTKKEPSKSPKKPIKSTPSKTPVAKKAAIKTPAKAKPTKKTDEKDKAQIKKLNDELKKIVEDKPLKERLEHIKKDPDKALQKLEKGIFDNPLLDVEVEHGAAENMEIDAGREEDDKHASKNCDTPLPEKRDNKVTVLSTYDSIENIEIPEFTIQQRGNSDTECANKANKKEQKPRRASSVSIKDCKKKKPLGNSELPIEKSKFEKSAPEKILSRDHSQSKPTPPEQPLIKEKLPPKSKESEKSKMLVDDVKSSPKIPAKNKDSESIKETPIIKDKLPPKAAPKNKVVESIKEASSKEKPSPKIPVKNKNLRNIKDGAISDQKSLPEMPVEDKNLETNKILTIVEEKTPPEIPAKNLEPIEKVIIVEEKSQPKIPVKNTNPEANKKPSVTKDVPSKLPVENKDVEKDKESSSEDKLVKPTNLETPKDVSTPKDKLPLKIPAKNKNCEILKSLSISKDNPSPKILAKNKPAGTCKEVTIVREKTTCKNKNHENAESEVRDIINEPVDLIDPKPSDIQLKAASKKPKIKIIRTKSKSSEEDEDEENTKELVTTSEQNQVKKSTPSCEESDTDTPKLVFAGDKTAEDKPMVQTISASGSKIFCLESKKIIFKKNKTATEVETKEDTSPRKAEAFSADNENSVYAFEPDLPTTSPPFRRLKPVTPPKNIISGNSIAVQVNFESNTKIECSSSSEAQVSSTTDCDDRVFYIPIQNSGTNSTLGVAVKLDTDGANQKIIMSATLVTKSPSFTTTTATATTVASTSAIPETSNNQIEPEEQIDELPKKPVSRETNKIVATADSQTSTQTPSDSPSSTVVSPKPIKKICPPPKASQSVKIVKINKCKKPPPPKPKAKPIKSKSSNKKVTPEVTKPTESTSKCEILEAPTFYPSEAEFNDPLKYIDTIRSAAEKYGLCRIVPPSTFRPECKVADEMRFTAYNQYVHKMLHRWGPNVKEMMAIKKFLATQNIHFNHPPWIGGMEVDLPRLYEIVQQCGGLKAVIEKERWHQVADVMRIPKLAQDRITKLDDIYCKYLLPYDILSHNEREKLFEEIEEEWNTHLKNPNDDNEVFDDVDECIVKGRTMPLSCFYRIARNTMMMCFGNVEGQPEGPSTESIETEFWNHVSKRKSHICVHSGSIDTGMHGYGFSVAKNSTFRKHPWNLKVLTNNSASILRSLGPIIGVTVPTLHVAMLYSACCWYRDPHGLPWIEYLHTGANKIWYGIPDEYSEQFRKAMLFLVPQYCRDKRLWLPSDTVMIPPPLLAAHNVPLSRVVQQPGQFIVVFPKSFTSCISTGYMVSESVYFAHASWLNSAKQIFSDMQESCEPSVFSLEQLLISVATDVRANLMILEKILPLLIELRDSEVALRNQLDELGLTASEKMKINKKRKSKASFNDEDNYECEICRANLFVSLVINSHEQTNYCLKHAVNLLQKKPTQVKYCKLMYAYTEEELEEIVHKVEQRIESKGTRKPNVKQSVAN